MLGKKTVSYTKLKTAMENDILQRFPAISQHISDINIEKGHLSADTRANGIGIAVGDSMCTKEALPLGVQPMKAMKKSFWIPSWILTFQILQTHKKKLSISQSTAKKTKKSQFM